MKIGLFFNLYNKQQFFTTVKMTIFSCCFLDFFHIFAQNIYIIEAVLNSTHNICLRAKIRK